MTARLLLGTLLCALPLAAAPSPALEQEKLARRDAAQLPPQLTQVDGLLVPVPSEIFATLDRFAHYDWRRVQRPDLATLRPRADQASIALLLGAVIAEGVIAVQAEDADEVEQLGRAVLTLARGLGVQRWAIGRSRSIVDHAQSGNWAAVREEWNRVLPDVQEGMNALRSEQLAHVISLGGWARGAEALATLVNQKYIAEHAELLRQPAMLAHFEAQLLGVSRERRGSAAVPRTGEHLRKFRGILEAGTPQISPTEVKDIAATAAALIKSATREKRSR